MPTKKHLIEQKRLHATPRRKYRLEELLPSNGEALPIIQDWEQMPAVGAETDTVAAFGGYRPLVLAAGSPAGQNVSSACVWDDIEETREAADAMAHRSCLLIALMGSIRAMQQSDARIGARLGLPRKHICQIRRGHWIDLDIETLNRLTTTVGLQPDEIWQEHKQRLDEMRAEIEIEKKQSA